VSLAVVRVVVAKYFDQSQSLSQSVSQSFKRNRTRDIEMQKVLSLIIIHYLLALYHFGWNLCR